MVNKESDRLESIKNAHHFKPRARTPRMEDYLEVIYELVERKGYATTGDISDYLNVSSPSVTKMMQRLHETGYLVYERYKGISLTAKGTEVSQGMRQRHGILAEFLIMLGVDEDTAHRDAEGIEHYLEPKTLEKLESFVKAVRNNPELLKKARSSR
ncbi:MAG: transcriptional regulator MntR [Nitrososphaerales archaeon]